jgi:hypothetical protein
MIRKKIIFWKETKKSKKTALYPGLNIMGKGMLPMCPGIQLPNAGIWVFIK